MLLLLPLLPIKRDKEGGGSHLFNRGDRDE